MSLEQENFIKLGEIVNSLQEEIAGLRQEVAALRVHMQSRHPYHFLDPRRYMEFLSSLETARFCLDNMKDENGVFLTFYENPFDLLAVAASKVSIDGLCLEFGVNAGTTINIIANQLPERTIYGFDWFQGLPEDWRPEYRKGTFKRDIPEVRENVELVVGLFSDTLPQFLSQKAENIAFIHVDCDLYSSTKDIFELAHSRFVPGSIIVFDEFYRYLGWQQGEYKAFNELVEKIGMKYRFFGYSIEQVALEVLSVNNSCS